MPLRARDGRLIEALEMLNTSGGGPFIAEDEHLAETLAAHCATAIENALLYERLLAAPRHGTARTQRPTLLVADDDPALASVIAQALDDFSVARALDGEEALARFHAERPDLPLLPLILPKKDGLETCREDGAAPTGRELPSIMLSGSTEPRHVVRAFEVGANDYIIKPFTPAQLRAKTHTWLPRAARPGESRALRSTIDV